MLKGLKCRPLRRSRLPEMCISEVFTFKKRKRKKNPKATFFLATKILKEVYLAITTTTLKEDCLAIVVPTTREDYLATQIPILITIKEDFLATQIPTLIITKEDFLATLP